MVLTKGTNIVQKSTVENFALFAMAITELQYSSCCILILSNIKPNKIKKMEYPRHYSSLNYFEKITIQFQKYTLCCCKNSLASLIYFCFVCFETIENELKGKIRESDTK